MAWVALPPVLSISSSGQEPGPPGTRASSRFTISKKESGPLYPSAIKWRDPTQSFGGEEKRPQKETFSYRTPKLYQVLTWDTLDVLTDLTLTQGLAPYRMLIHKAQMGPLACWRRDHQYREISWVSPPLFGHAGSPLLRGLFLWLWWAGGHPLVTVPGLLSLRLLGAEHRLSSYGSWA